MSTTAKQQWQYDMMRHQSVFLFNITNPVKTERLHGSEVLISFRKGILIPNSTDCEISIEVVNSFFFFFFHQAVW